MSYNSFAPINNLPAEVMSSIILLNATEIMDEYPTWHQKSMSWISSTQVCRQWRAVALDFPALWSKILFVHPELAESMIRLSKDAPLTVKAVVHGTEFIDAISKIFAQSHRLRTLDLSGFASPAFISAFTTPAPVLKNLVLSPPPNVTVTLPTGFLQGQAPLLHSVEVRHLAPQMWGKLPLGPNLTTLELSSASPGSQGLSPKEILISLRRMPLLQTLSLVDILPLDPEGYPQAGQTNFPPLPLPALRTIELSDGIVPITAFLGAIDIPREATVRIKLLRAIQETRCVEDFFANLVTSWVQKLQADIKGLIVSEDYNYSRYDGSPRTLIVQCFFRCPPVQDSDPSQLTISFLDPRPRVQEYLATLNQYLDLYSVSYLMVEGRSGRLVSIFSHLRNLEMIALRNTPVHGFLEALEDTSKQLPFPGLSTLDLLDIDFTVGYNYGTQSVIGGLVAALSARALVCPLGFLRISQCKYFGSAAYDFIRASLPELLVEWDEVIL
jgi:hypothetical protein